MGCAGFHRGVSERGRRVPESMTAAEWRIGAAHCSPVMPPQWTGRRAGKGLRLGMVGDGRHCGDRALVERIRARCPADRGRRDPPKTLMGVTHDPAAGRFPAPATSPLWASRTDRGGSRAVDRGLLPRFPAVSWMQNRCGARTPRGQLIIGVEGSIGIARGEGACHAHGAFPRV